MCCRFVTTHVYWLVLLRVNIHGDYPNDASAAPVEGHRRRVVHRKRASPVFPRTELKSRRGTAEPASTPRQRPQVVEGVFVSAYGGRAASRVLTFAQERLRRQIPRHRRTRLRHGSSNILLPGIFAFRRAPVACATLPFARRGCRQDSPQSQKKGPGQQRRPQAQV